MRSNRVNGNEFLRRLAKLGKRAGVAVRFDPQHDDGSHGRVFYGTRFATLKERKKELGRGLLHAMCRELGIDVREL